MAEIVKGDLNGVKSVSYSSFSDSSGDTPSPSQRRRTGPTKRAKGGWTKEEDDLLTEVVRKFRGRNWKRIASYVSGRTDVQCLHRWQKVLNPDLVKGPWTKEEDARIIELVGKFGCKKWSVIAKSLPGRIGKQCRERWYNHLDPTIKKDAWSRQEEAAIIHYHQLYGNKWAEIAKFLPGRTDNAIKNHWNCSLKKMDLYVSDGSLQERSPPKFYSGEVEPQNMTDKSINQGFVKAASLHQKMKLDYSVPSCSTDLVLGSPGGGETVQRLQPVKRESCSSSSGGMNDIIDSPGQIHVDDDGATLHGMTKEFLRINSSHAEACNPLLDSSSSIHLYSTPCAYLMTSFRIPDSARRPRSSAMDVTNLNFDNEPESSFLILSTGGTDDGSVQVNKKIKLHVGPPYLQNKSSGSLSHEPHVLKDMVVADENDCFSPRDNQRRISSSPCCSTPYTCTKSISANISSPESILRIAAMSYKNTPSIIRKRSFRNAAVSAQPGCSCKINDANLGTRDMEIVDKADSVNVHLSLLSSLSKPDETAALRSVERCLEHAFDMEWVPAEVAAKSEPSTSTVLPVGVEISQLQC